MTLTPVDAGWIEVICGSMFSGKTEELMRRLRRAEIAKMNIIIFKPMIDSRYSENQIVSHNQLKMDSHLLDTISQIPDLVKETDVIGIDEAQFFDDSLVEICKDWLTTESMVRPRSLISRFNLLMYRMSAGVSTNTFKENKFLS